MSKGDVIKGEAGQLSSYDEWNDAIVGHYFHEQHAGRSVVLCVDAETLKNAWNGQFPSAEFETCEDAQEEFVAAVVRHLKALEQAAHDGHFWFSGSTQTHQVPRQMGLLAIQVLAAMQVEEKDGNDDASWQSSYWPKLHCLLDQVPNPGSPPIGLSVQMHQDMWRDVERWANTRNNEELGRMQLPPETENTAFRHIRLPMSQALLGPRDLGKLFSEVRKAELPIADDQAIDEAKIRAWLSEPDLKLTARTRQVLNDSSRSGFACQQIIDAWPHRKEYEPNGRRRARTRRARIRRQCEIELVIEDQIQTQPSPQLKMYVVANPASDHPERRELRGEEISGWLRNASVSEQEFADLGVTFHAQAGALVATASRSIRRFRTGTKLRPGRTALLLCHRIAYQPLGTGGVGWKKSLEDCCVDITRYCPPGFYQNGFTSLPGVPADHVLLKFTISPDLEPGIDLRGRWPEILRTAWQPIELAGGLLLSRRIWMRGATPVVRVTDPKRVTALRFDDADFVCPPTGRLIDELLQEGRRTFQLQAERATGSPRSTKLKLKPPRYDGPRPEAKSTGWILQDNGWTLAAEISDSNQPVVSGLLVSGDLPPSSSVSSTVTVRKPSREQTAIGAMTSRWNKLHLGRAIPVFQPRSDVR
ncbi:MAG: hypothetical protein R3C59_05355 [Planctomycetaceae bacterium]